MKLLLFSIYLLAFGETIDFSKYRIGFNNRTLLGAVIGELVAEYGVSVQTAFKDRLMAQDDVITIDEVTLDNYLKETADPKEREAIARFILTHEYFHVYLKHSSIRNELRTPQEIEITGPFSEARKQMEQQADHLAAKHLHKLGLPLEPIRQLFLRHPELHGGDNYPTAEERARAVMLAREAEIHHSYFDNAAVRCVTLLGELGSRLRLESFK